MGFTIAISGDSIVSRKLSVCSDERFVDLVAEFEQADIGYTHLETLLHDFEGPEVYPAAEAGGTWQRAPPFVADELRRTGFNLVSHASNHALDYSYGGLRQTWEALDDAGITHAGTGKNLTDARSPSYLETENGRVGLVSMTTSFTRWSRAGQPRPDVGGRPGLNPVGHYYEVDAGTMETIRDLAKEFGLWITRFDEEIIINRGGLHNTLDRYVLGDVDGAELRLNEDDVDENLRSIADAAHQADIALAHLHTHDFDPDGDISTPPDAIEAFARDCIDAGADVVVFQGSHAPMRGIEIYKDNPIFYDPGDFIFMPDTVEKLPTEFYERHAHDLPVHPLEATPSEGFRSRDVIHPWHEDPGSDDEETTTFGSDDNLLNPEGGMFTGPGSIVPVCEFDEDLDCSRITIYPSVWFEEPIHLSGIPKAATGEKADEILAHLDQLSEQYGTEVAVEDGTGVVRP